MKRGLEMDERLIKKKQLAIRKTLKEVKSGINGIRELRESPSQSLEFFFSSADKAFRGEKRAFLQGKKIVGTTCINVPEELIYAAGAIPLRICNGSYAFDQIGSEFLPTKSCSLVKSLAGSMFMSQHFYGIQPDLIINPTTCDQKKKIAETDAAQNVEIYTLDVPPSKESEASQLFWQQSVVSLLERLQKLSGKTITRKKLKEAILLVSKAQSAYRKLLELRQKGNVIWGTEAILISNTYFFEDIHQWTSELNELNKQLQSNLENGQFVCDKNTPRILVTGSPSIFPNLKLPQLLEQSGAIIVTDEFCSSNRLLYDMAVVDEWNMYDMIPALADKYLKPNTCPNFTPNTDRKRKLVQAIKDYQVDGVVYQTFSGCQLFDMESQSIGKELKAHNTPVLFVETDYSPDDYGQLSTRVEAFIESLKSKK